MKSDKPRFPAAYFFRHKREASQRDNAEELTTPLHSLSIVFGTPSASTQTRCNCVGARLSHHEVSRWYVDNGIDCNHYTATDSLVSRFAHIFESIQQRMNLASADFHRLIQTFVDNDMAEIVLQFSPTLGDFHDLVYRYLSAFCDRHCSNGLPLTLLNPTTRATSLNCAMKLLPCNQAQLLKLYYLDQLDHHSICERLMISASTFPQVLDEALHQLRRTLIAMEGQSYAL